MKIDENGTNTDIAFLHKTLLKNTQHTLQLHIENFYERNKIAGATAQPTDKNYTVKDYCTNKTLKIDENGINTDIAFLHKTLLKKAPPHQMKRNKKNNGSVTVSVVFIQLNHTNFCIFCYIATSKFQRRCTKNFNTCANICYQSALPIP